MQLSDLITYDKCYLQCVGKTVQKPNSRFNWHKAGFKHSERHGHCCILTEFFNKGVSKKCIILCRF